MAKIIYIAGPLTKGDVAGNIRNAMMMANNIARLRTDVVPHIPHLTFFWDLAFHKPYEWWLEYDRAFIDKCSGLIRLPGESNGADEEVKYARKKYKPILILGMNGQSLQALDSINNWLNKVCASSVKVSRKPRS